MSQNIHTLELPKTVYVNDNNKKDVIYVHGNLNYTLTGFNR